MIISLLVILFSIQIFYYAYFYSQIFSFRPLANCSKDKEIGISVIISAHNEEKSLQTCIEAIMQQLYSNFEVIVVNDCSTDQTANKLKYLSTKFKNLTVLHRTESKPSKKKALSLAIEKSVFEWLVFTDADCIPASNKWLQTLAGNMHGKKEIVLGYGAYFSAQGFINQLIRYETMFIALQYFTFAKRNIPYMATGRNMAYRKSLFYRVNGFANHLHVLSGDDDLFIADAATAQNVALAAGVDSFTYSVPKRTFGEWVRQKRRHITTSGYYKTNRKLVLGVEIVSRFFYNVLMLSSVFIIFALSTNNLLFQLIVIICFSFRTIVFLMVIFKSIGFFNEKRLLLIAILFDFLIPFLYLYIGFLNMFYPKTNTWK